MRDEGGHDWSVWAWLSTTNPNQHTFSLLHFQCTSHYSEYNGLDIGLCPHFCPEPVILGGKLLWTLRCMGSESCRGALPPFITACSSSLVLFFFSFPESHWVGNLSICTPRPSYSSAPESETGFGGSNVLGNSTDNLTAEIDLPIADDMRRHEIISWVTWAEIWITLLL